MPTLQTMPHRTDRSAFGLPLVVSGLLSRRRVVRHRGASVEPAKSGTSRELRRAAQLSGKSAAATWSSRWAATTAEASSRHTKTILDTLKSILLVETEHRTEQTETKSTSTAGVLHWDTKFSCTKETEPVRRFKPIAHDPLTGHGQFHTAYVLIHVM